MVSSNLPSIKRWDGDCRRESADIPHSHERGERSAQAIPSARNDNGRDRPLSLLCLLPLPALLRHVTSGRRRDYFRPHTPPRSGGFPYGGGVIASISARPRALLAVGHRTREPSVRPVGDVSPVTGRGVHRPPKLRGRSCALLAVSVLVRGISSLRPGGPSEYGLLLLRGSERHSPGRRDKASSRPR